jgi:hypothetical protein
MNIRALLSYKKTVVALTAISLSILDLAFLAIVFAYYSHSSFLYTLAELEASFFKKFGITCPAVFSCGIPEIIAVVILGIKLGENNWERVKLMILGFVCTFLLLNYLPVWIMAFLIAASRGS